MFSSLRFRLIIALVLVVVAVVGGIVFASTQVTAQTFRGYEDQRDLLRNARFRWFLGSYYTRHQGWTDVQAEIERLGQLTGGRVILTEVGGQVIADSEGDLIGAVADQSWGEPAFSILYRGVQVGYLFFSPPEQPLLEQFLASANRTLLLVAVGAGVGAVLLVLGLSRRILAPVKALEVAAQRMAAGDLSQRVEVSSKDEIGDLARAFNHMANGLAHLEELRSNMVTDVAHELRTPLTNIRGYLEALRDGVAEPSPMVIDSLYEEAMLLNRLVDDLQELSLAEAGQIDLDMQPIQVGVIVSQAIQSMSLRAEAAGVGLHSDVPDSLPPVAVDSRRIGQVLRNLLQNAIAYTPSGGWVCVTAQPGEGEVVVRVADAGGGIAAEDMPYIFERFYRADKSRARATGGAGLGLSITKSLVEAHGGRVWVESVEGEGATFFFTLRTA
jgi:signal transduction histidine kinase